ncbi:MAG: very short patch repair endonuclease [Thermoleophilia bacterium]
MTKEQRTRCMSNVRSKDTIPEMAVRRMAHSLGYRYRLHQNNMPGCPDMVFVRQRKVIFVHGCFWHSHPKCKHASIPKTRKRFWATKLKGNEERDSRNQKKLELDGWAQLVVWECEVKNQDILRKTIKSFLDGSV